MGNEEGTPNWLKYEKFVSELGKWAWIIGIINGLIDLIWGIYGEIYFLSLGFGLYIIGPYIWLIISGTLMMIISFIIIKPDFSDKCANKDWDFLLNWVIPLGNIRFPWMLFWGIILEIFGYGWGGLPVLIPALFLIFAGPKPYNWKVEK